MILCLYKQGGTPSHDRWAGAATTIDGSIVLAGWTRGEWMETPDERQNNAMQDFAAISMDDEGLPLWSYQVNPWGIVR